MEDLSLGVGEGVGVAAGWPRRVWWPGGWAGAGLRLPSPGGPVGEGDRCNALVEQARRLLRRRRGRTVQGDGHRVEPRLVVGLGRHVLGGADASANGSDIAEGGRLVAVCSAATAGPAPPAGADRAAACRGRVVGARRR